MTRPATHTGMPGTMAEADPPCWVITTGEAGMTNQAIALAEAVGLDYRRFTLDLPAPWRWLPGHLAPGVLKAARAAPDPLSPPWPRLLISCGRRSTHAAIAIRRAASGTCFAVHVQDPLCPPHYFDMVVPPRHDGLNGSNVVSTFGAIHGVTAGKLDRGRETFAGLFAPFARPLIGCLIGGTSRSSERGPDAMGQLARMLANAARSSGGTIIATPSRRTPPEELALLEDGLAGVPHWIWDGSGDNPYFGILGLADHLVVTGDSVSMVSEALATGKPVHVAMPERCGRRLTRFHDDMAANGYTRPFDGSLPGWHYMALDETGRIAGLIRQALGIGEGG